jgi:hypothetical protein
MAMMTDDERRERWREIEGHFARLSAVVSPSIREAQQAMGTMHALFNGAATATDETRPTYDDLATIVREIGESDPLRDDYGTTQGRCCRYCERAMVSEHYEFRPEYRVHAPDCLWTRCREIAARLPPG